MKYIIENQLNDQYEIIIDEVVGIKHYSEWGSLLKIIDNKIIDDSNNIKLIYTSQDKLIQEYLHKDSIIRIEIIKKDEIIIKIIKKGEEIC